MSRPGERMHARPMELADPDAAAARCEDGGVREGVGELERIEVPARACRAPRPFTDTAPAKHAGALAERLTTVPRGHDT